MPNNQSRKSHNQSSGLWQLLSNGRLMGDAVTVKVEYDPPMRAIDEAESHLRRCANLLARATFAA